jgi:GNAT superfamily N-acetyltransferase
VAEIAVEVIDDWQRRGVGRSLLAELRMSALRAGCRRLEWFAFESNRAVAALATIAAAVTNAHHGSLVSGYKTAFLASIGLSVPAVLNVAIHMRAP